MAYKHLFVDSDVILDMLFNREPYYIYTELLIADRKVNNLQLSTSSLVIANINYILTKKIGAARAKESIKLIVGIIHVLPFERDAIESALVSSFNDFEDSIQHYIATKSGAEAIITRNIKDYKQSTIPVLTAEQFLRTL
jgi:predicted nucleic acid-binding protein